MPKTTTALVSDFSSSQDWAIDPEKVIVYFPQRFIEKAEAAVGFMSAGGCDKCIFWFVGDYKFVSPDSSDEDDEEPSQQVAEIPGYVEFEPEFAIDGCHMEVLANGEIKFSFQFKHTADEGWANDRYTVDQLKSMFSGS